MMIKSLLLGILIQTTLFEEKINHILQEPVLKSALVGIEIAETGDGKSIYSYNSEKLFLPASNIKIITALTAFTLLNPEFRFKTEVYCDSLDLYIKGYGDPTFCTEDLWKVAEKVVECGIRKVRNIIYDDSYFDDKETAEGWIEEAVAYGFNSRISALSLNRNCIKIFIKPGDSIGDEIKFILYPKTEFVEVINLASTGDKDSIYIDRKFKENKNYVILRGTLKRNSKGETFIRHIATPSIYTATVFSEILQKKGVDVIGRVIKGQISDSLHLIYSHFSEPLVHLVYEMNKESINFYADQILKTIGAECLGPPGSFEKSVMVVSNFLDSLGLTQEEFRLYDGSGLSRYNLISPRGIVKVLLKGAEKSEINPEFMSSLPTSGVDGTLRFRLRSSRTIRRIRAKTGTMMGINSLSGYTLTNKDNLIAFSIIINNYTVRTPLIKEIQDRILRLIINEL